MRVPGRGFPLPIPPLLPDLDALGYSPAAAGHAAESAFCFFFTCVFLCLSRALCGHILSRGERLAEEGGKTKGREERVSYQSVESIVHTSNEKFVECEYGLVRSLKVIDYIWMIIDSEVKTLRQC